jgi:glycosyltransferase involved in cell wall biosynthesis
MEEVLVDGKNALLVTDYKNPSEWADAIQRVTNNSEVRDSLVSGALEDSKLYTWDNRGKEITRFIQEGIH